MSGSSRSMGDTIMSHVLVPMIFTSVPGLMPAPTAPMCASKAPDRHGHARRQADGPGDFGRQLRPPCRSAQTAGVA